MTFDRAARRFVLLVDDDPDSLGALTDTLEAAGLTALVARNGLAALDLLERIEPDVILLDALMPGPSGFETCRRIKAMPRFALTPVIFLTGLGDTEHVLDGLRAGGVDYVVKPIDQSVLLERVRVHIANADLVNEARAALDASGPGVLALDPSGQMSWASEGARNGIGVNKAGSADRVLREVAAWIQACDGLPVSRCKVLRTPGNNGNALEFSLIGRAASGDILIRTKEIEDISDEDLLARELDLSPRESEVLIWIAHGKANKDIADIMGLSPRTVTKHVEQIFQKLGVENRTAAALAALKFMRSESDVRRV